MDVEMVKVVLGIEALPVVTLLSPLAASSKNSLGTVLDRSTFRVKNMGGVGNNKQDLYV